MHVSKIHVYPLKGARGIPFDRADVLTGGLRHDRRFMSLRADGTFITQRSHPRLALLETALVRDARGGDTLVLRSPDAGSVEISLATLSLVAPEQPRRRVRIFRSETDAIEVPGGAAELLSAHLGERCLLAFMPDDVIRPVETPFGAPGDHVGFADGFPVLLATEASLADLNARLETPVPMNRFRPNIVISGGEAFEEERYRRVRVGTMVFRMPKRCARCQVTVVDQATAEVGKEPLRTLATYRTTESKVYFGQNLIPDAEGVVAIGDEVTYLEPF